MSDPDIKGRFTPHILDITQALTRLRPDLKAESGEEQPDTTPPAGDAALLRRIADALKSAGDGCDGGCGLPKQECANEIGIVQEASVTAGGPDEVTWIEGTTTALAQVMLTVRDLEVAELRRSLAISRKRTQHFAQLYSEALDELEDIAP